MSVAIPTELIGSVPRPIDPSPQNLQETIRALEATGEAMVTDGEQTKPSFVGYPLAGLNNLSPDGVKIHFVDGHFRQLPVLTEGPFRYARYAGEYVKAARPFTTRPIKQAVISASAISLIYPSTPLASYPKAQFLQDLVAESVKDIRSCFEAGAAVVQVDFTEGRLACKLDPTLSLLKDCIALNNMVLSHFTAEERQRIGVHSCPGGDRDSTHSADVDYAILLPHLFQLHCGRFYVELAGEKDPEAALRAMKEHLKPGQRLFVGVIDVLNPVVETKEQVCERVLQALKYIPLEALGTCDDCGFSPFCDDLSTPRETAFAKIAARVQGTALAAAKLSVPQ